jgi:hypothetical protein
MKLLQCKKCDTYTRKAAAEVTLVLPMEIDIVSERLKTIGTQHITSTEVDLLGITDIGIISVCQELEAGSDKICAGKLTIVDEVDCPHKTESKYWNVDTVSKVRTCVLCGEQDEGMVIFD